MSTILRPLLDAIEIKHGPRLELGRYFLQLAENARQLGISLHMGCGSSRLNEVNKRNHGTWKPLGPVYDPEVSGIDEGNSIYIEGQFEGDPVLTLILRRYDWPQSTLRQEWESGRFAYRDPAIQMGPDERWIAEAPIAGEISGRVVFVGGLWSHPAFRRKRLPVLTIALMRSISLAIWRPDFAIGMIEAGPMTRALLPFYGYPPIQPGMKIVGGWRTFESNLIWETPDMITAHVLNSLTGPDQPDQRDRRDEGIRRVRTPR